MALLAGACSAVEGPAATNADFEGDTTAASKPATLPGGGNVTTTTAPVTPTSAAPTTTTAPPVSGTGMVGGAGFSEGSSILGDSDAELARRLDGMKAAGASWLRVDIRWPDAEPSKGTFQWWSADRVINAASSRGLKVLGILDFTPSWARPSGTTEKYPPTNVADYANFARVATQHFGSKVQALEVWNEANSPHFWAPGANAAAYTALLKPAYTAIKSVNPNITVLAGSTSPGATGGGWIAPVDFLNGMYAAGARGYFDAFSHHGYNWPFMPLRYETNYNWNAFGGVTPVLHNVMANNGDGAKRIWMTENGAPVVWTRQGVTTSPSYLAAYVAESFRAMRSWSWSGPLFFYSYRDPGTNPNDSESLFGLVNHDFVPKGAALDAFIAGVRGS
jgi:hypothetical protein